MEKRPLLSIALLCSNRIDTVRRCLDSLVPILERIPSELILLDTSTDPEVPLVLAEYTDNITKFKWVNDFSAARNETVKLAKGEWYLYIDDDEWFVELDELYDFFESGEYKEYGCANYIQRNFHDPDLIHYSDSWASRMIRLTPETHFESKIHEYLTPAPGKCKNLHVVANHTGYIAITQEDRERRFNRNSVLLYEMMEEEPERLRWRVQLAQEYLAIHKWDELIDFCIDSIEFTKDRTDKYDCRDVGTFYAGAVEGYINKEQYDKVLEVGEKALLDKRINELCYAYIYIRIAVAAFCIDNLSLAKKSIDSYFLIRKALQSDRNKLEFQQGALIVDDAFDVVPTKKVYSILIGIDLKERKLDALKTYLKNLEWDKKVIYAFEPLVPVIIDAMAEMDYDPVFAETMQLMWNNRELQKRVLLQVCELAETSKEVRLHYILAQISGEHWFLWYAKAMVADIDEDREGLIQALQGLFQNIKNIFQMPNEITQLIHKYKISQEALYLSVPFETWVGHLRNFIGSVSEQELLIVERDIAMMKSQENIRYDYFFARVAEVELLYHAAEREYNDKRAYMQAFSEKVMQFLRKYYQPQVFVEIPELLPEYGQAALLIERGLALEKSNPTEMLHVLKKVVEVYPTLTNIIRGFLSAYAIEQDAIKRRQKEEMQKLKEQILVQVQDLAAKRQYDTALSIVQQLKQMHPDDLELVALALELRLATL